MIRFVDSTSARIHILLPAALLLGLVACVTAIHYAFPRGPWVTALYLDGRDAFTAVAPHVKAIAADDANTHSATVYIDAPNQRDQLLKTGAILLDTQGIPLCLRTPRLN